MRLVTVLLISIVVVVLGCKKENSNFGGSSASTCRLESETTVGFSDPDSVAAVYEGNRFKFYEKYRLSDSQGDSSVWKMYDKFEFIYTNTGELQHTVRVSQGMSDTIADYIYQEGKLVGVLQYEYQFGGLSNLELINLFYQGNQIVAIETINAGESTEAVISYHEDGILDRIEETRESQNGESETFAISFEFDARYTNYKFLVPQFISIDEAVTFQYLCPLEIKSYTVEFAEGSFSEDVEEFDGRERRYNLQGYNTSKISFTDTITTTYRCP